MELFIHKPGSEHPEIVEVEEAAVIRTLVVHEGDDGYVWVEEAECAFRRSRPPVPVDLGHVFRLKPATRWATPVVVLLDVVSPLGDRVRSAGRRGVR